MVTKVRILHDTVIIPTGSVATTQGASDNTTKVATTAYVTTALANLADSAPSTLNTLNELAAALGDDANFSTTVTNSIATKAPLASPSLTGTVTVTGASSDYNTLQLTSNSTGHGTIINLGDTSDANYGSITQFASSAGEGGRMRFVAGTTETMNLRGGNVGIGTSSPAKALHIVSASNQIRIEDSTNNRKYDLNVDGDKFMIDDMTAGANRFAISGANVGIGTSSPGTKLHIVGASSSRNTIVSNLTLDGGTSAANPYDGFGFGINFIGRDYGNAIRNYAHIHSVIENQTSNSGGGDAGFKSLLSFYTNSGGASGTNPTEKMRITSDGKVGIGESAPSNAKLEILQAGDHNAHSTHGIAIHSTGNTNFTSMYMGAEDGIDSAYIQSAALDGSFTSKSLLLNANGGNVGIGTTDPDGFKTKITSAAKGLFVQSGSGGYTSLGFTGDGGTTKGSITSTSGLLYFGSENSGGTGSNGEIRVTPGTGNVMAIDGANSYVGIGTSSPGNRLEVGSNNQRNGISLRGGANGNAVMVEMVDAKTGSFSTVTVDIQYSGAGGYGYEIHTYGTSGSFYQVGGGYTNNTNNFSHSVSQTNGSTWTVSSPSSNLLRVVAPAGGTHPGIHVKAFGALSVGLDQTDITITYA